MLSNYQSSSTILAYHDVLVGSCLRSYVVGALLDGCCSVLHKAMPELGHGRTPSSLVRSVVHLVRRAMRHHTQRLL